MDFFKGMKLIGGNVPMVPAAREEPKVEVKNIVATEKGEPKKKGRPNMKERKKELRKAQMSALDVFIETKPSKAKVREYFETRIKQLKEEE